MRIAFFVSVFPTLSETFIQNQITGLLDMGHEVEVFAGYESDATKVHPDVLSYDLISRTSYLCAPKNKLRRIFGAAPLIIRKGLPHFLDMVRSLNPLRHGRSAWNLQALYRCAALIDKEPFDIVLAHFGPNGVIAGSLMSEGLLQGKLVTTFHGCDMSSDLEELGYHIYDSLLERGDLFLPISEHWQAKLETMGFDPRKIAVHRMGVDTELFEFRPRKLADDETIRILTIARLTEKKGVEYGVRAIARLKDKYPKIEYRIAGDGLMRQEIEDLIDQLNVREHVKILGWKKQDEVAGLLDDSHFLIAPSVSSSDGDQEGIPVVLMEAMARGLPVVSTLHTGIPELVRDSVSGFLVPERDVDALTDRIGHLIEHSDTWPEMGRAGREIVQEDFDIGKLNRNLVRIFESLLNVPS